jgi:hypothetical protein
LLEPFRLPVHISCAGPDLGRIDIQSFDRAKKDLQCTAIDPAPLVVQGCATIRE